ncbi:MAG: hypothetical protein PHH77_05390 [Victivallaceae bacterium]|nr:hypothetical protein [Victivallaceae bacterium]
MNRSGQTQHLKGALLIGIAVFFCYFFSEMVLRQFVLHRAGVPAISLSSLLGKLPPGIRDEVTRQITIAELKDELKAATTVGRKITVSIALAGMFPPQKLQEKYAEIIDKYPTTPESLPAFINFLLAPPAALKSISVARYHEFIKHLDKHQRFWAWSSGFDKLKSRKAAPAVQMEYLLPLLDVKPDRHEYQRLYVALSELAFQEEKREIELKSRKFEEQCEQLPFFDEQLEKEAKARAEKKAKAKKNKELAEAKAKVKPATKPAAGGK